MAIVTNVLVRDGNSVHITEEIARIYLQFNYFLDFVRISMRPFALGRF